MNNLYHPDSIFNEFSLKEMKKILDDIPYTLAQKHTERIDLYKSIKKKDEYELLEFENEDAQLLFSFLIRQLRSITEIEYQIGEEQALSKKLNQKKWSTGTSVQFFTDMSINGSRSYNKELNTKIEKKWNKIVKEYLTPPKTTGDSEKDHYNSLDFDHYSEEFREQVNKLWGRNFKIKLIYDVIHELRVFQKIKKINQDTVHNVQAFNEQEAEEYRKMTMDTIHSDEYEAFLKREVITAYEESFIDDGTVDFKGKDIFLKKEEILKKQKDGNYKEKISNMYLNKEFNKITLKLVNGSSIENEITPNQKQLLELIFQDPKIQFSEFSNYELADLKGGDVKKALKWIDNTSRELNKKIKKQSNIDNFLKYNTDYTQINNKNINEEYLRNP